jgi:hypothetical protein
MSTYMYVVVMYFFQHCFICRPSDSTLSEDAEMQLDALTTQQDLVHYVCRYVYIFNQAIPSPNEKYLLLH